MNNLAAKEVQVDQLKMLHQLDASVMALARTLDEGITATPYGFADWLDSLGGTVSDVRRSVDELWHEQQKHTRALNRIADALERFAPPETTADQTTPPSTSLIEGGGDDGHELTDEEYEEFQAALERND